MHRTTAPADELRAPYGLQNPIAGVQLRFFPYVVEPSRPAEEPMEETTRLPDDLIGMYYTG